MSVQTFDGLIPFTKWPHFGFALYHLFGLSNKALVFTRLTSLETSRTTNPKPLTISLAMLSYGHSLATVFNFDV